MKQSILVKALYKARDLRSRVLFDSLKQYCRGDVLDVGGDRFYLSAKSRGIKFKSWTNLENDKTGQIRTDDDDYKFVYGDGCNMKFKSNSFDTVLNIQVLEHVFEPNKMFQEISRVLKPGGYAIILIPQTSVLHLAPYHYYNFTRYWAIQAAKTNGLKVVKITPIGGLFSSLASNLVLFFLQVFRVEGMSMPENRRNILFYLFLPFTFLYAIINIPILLFFSLGDLSEEPNNNLIVFRKGKRK